MKIHKRIILDETPFVQFGMSKEDHYNKHGTKDFKSEAEYEKAADWLVDQRTFTSDIDSSSRVIGFVTKYKDYSMLKYDKKTHYIVVYTPRTEKDLHIVKTFYKADDRRYMQLLKRDYGREFSRDLEWVEYEQ